MRGDPRYPESALTPKVAERVLARAAEIDAASGEDLSVIQLSDIAMEAGISASAVAGALREYRAEEAPVPGWVRLCLIGVPDRAMALRYYGIFLGGLCLSPLLLRFGDSAVTRGLVAGGVAAFFAGALWSTSRAVRWMDRHGWHRLS